MKTDWRSVAWICALLYSAAVLAEEPRIPLAIYHDPPADAAFPASAQGVQISSRGQSMNGLLYLPGGKGPNPVALLMHGLPGNEQNLDLAQVLRRAGWAVLTFHYRGSWGSAGNFGIENSAEDGDSAIAWLRNPPAGLRPQIDSSRIVLVGHSLGGYIAARSCASHELLGCVLVAPWDLSSTAQSIAGMSMSARQELAANGFGDVNGRLSGTNATRLVDVLASRGGAWQLAQFAPKLAHRSLLIVRAAHDSDAGKAQSLIDALHGSNAEHLSVETLDTGHSFDDHRIALETSVLSWLASLPGAPHLQ